MDHSLDASNKSSLQEILAKVIKNVSSEPFRIPVDPVALNIPDYPEKIKTPMDLSTISAKLSTDQYSSPEDFKADMTLMFTNCYTYNSKDSYVHNLGLKLEKYFKNLFNEAFDPSRKKRIKIQETAKKTSTKNVVSNMSDEEFKICNDVLNELFKPKHSDLTYPFIEPINDDIVPGYSKIIKHPTDLTTIKTKLEEKRFNSKSEFYKELKTMTQNCLKFNDEVKKIYDAGIELEKLIDSLLGDNKNTSKRISELKNQVKILEKEISLLEESSGMKSKKVMKNYSLEERLEIGNSICECNQIQQTRIAQIISKNGVQIDFVNKNEIEIDLRLLGDNILVEIEEYLRKTRDIKKENWGSLNALN